MSEDALWGYVRDKLLPKGIHATRVENRVSPGFPDVHYTYNGVTGSIELKFSRHPERASPFSDRPGEGLNRDQTIWINDEFDTGGLVWILAEITPYIYLLSGEYADHFNGLNQRTLANLSALVLKKRKLTSEKTTKLHKLLEKKG